MDQNILSILSLLPVAFTMAGLSQIIHLRMHRQLTGYVQGMLRYCDDERLLRQHLIEHGVPSTMASKIVMRAQRRMMEHRLAG